MKKILSFLMVAVVLVSCMATTVFAANVTVSATSASGKTGDTVTVNFNINGNTGFQSYGMTLDYDSNALELVGVTAGLTNPYRGGDKLNYAGTNTISDDGTLFSATFKIIAANKGTYSVGVNVSNLTMVDENYNTFNLSVETSGGSVTVTVPECAEHTYGDWSTVKEASCSAAGEKQRECGVCGHVESAAIDALPHNPETVTGKPASCTESGLTDGEQCSVCRTFTKPQEEIPPLGHKVENWTVDTEATCTTAGSKSGECETCHELVTEVIPTTGHKINGWKTDANNHWHECEVCGVVDKAAHTMKTVDGSKDKQCTVCGYQVKAPADSTLDNQPKTGDVFAEIAMFAAAAALAVGAVVVAKRKARN